MGPEPKTDGASGDAPNGGEIRDDEI